MAMSVGSGGGENEPMVEMNTTPLIDVLLVLLVMLIITIPVQMHSVKLDMPRPDQPPPPQTEEPEVIDIEVDFDGTVFWNGNPVSSLKVLEGYFKNVADQEPQPEIHLKPNRLVKYDYVTKVLAAAQRLGVKRLGFVGNEQYL